VDTYLGDREELRGIINSGHLRSGAFVIRNVGDDFEPRLFSTWAPKVLIGNRASRLNDTIIDRALVIELRRRTQHERVERLRLDRLDSACHTIRRRAARWANDHIDALREADPDVPAILNDRAADNWRALLAIAEEAGEGWSERARLAAVRLTGGETTSPDDSPGVLLLTDIRQFFADKGVSRVRSKEILSWLHQREGAPWGDWRHGQPITPRSLTRLLEPFHIAPKVLRIGATIHRGYELDQFVDAFSRYLPAYPKHESHVEAATTYPTDLGVTSLEGVTLGKDRNSLNDNDVTGVTEAYVENRGEAWEPNELG
jgi:putative DNA primase/helicase